MKDILEELFIQYNDFTPDPTVQQKIDESHQKLISSMGKPERKLILRIIDAKDMIAGAGAQESFNCGFWLAWRLLTQLHEYDGGHSVEENLNADGRFSMQKGGTDDEN